VGNLGGSRLLRGVDASPRKVGSSEVGNRCDTTLRCADPWWLQFQLAEGCDSNDINDGCTPNH
jgi:hypothetical protein